MTWEEYKDLNEKAKMLKNCSPTHIRCPECGHYVLKDSIQTSIYTPISRFFCPTCGWEGKS